MEAVKASGASKKIPLAAIFCKYLCPLGHFQTQNLKFGFVREKLLSGVGLSRNEPALVMH
jgi:hypothetical protein